MARTNISTLKINQPNIDTHHPEHQTISLGTWETLKTAGLFLWDPVGQLDKIGEMSQPIVCYKLGSKRVVHVIHSPAHIEQVLIKNQHNYWRKCSPYGLIKSVFGKGLLFNEGSSHLSQRRLMQPVFQPKFFTHLTEGVAERIDHVLNNWKGMEDKVIEVETMMSDLSQHIILQLLFGPDASPELTDILRSNVGKMGLLMGNIPLTPQNLKYRSAVKRLDTALFTIIQKRRTSTESPSDILTALMSAKDKSTGECMSDQQLRDELVTLLFSGFDTTARTLTWIFHSLNENPEIESRVLNEIDEVLNGQTPTYENLSDLTYLSKVIQETMRLYPPNTTIGRVAEADDVIGDCHIPKGSIITISPYLAHRNSDIWPDPEKFDPERFNSDESSSRSKFSYLPFGGGVRQCIGKGITMMTIPLAASMIAQRYSLRAPRNRRVRLDVKVTLHARDPYNMTLVRRKNI